MYKRKISDIFFFVVVTNGFTTFQLTEATQEKLDIMPPRRLSGLKTDTVPSRHLLVQSH